MFQNGAWHARHGGCYCDLFRWRRFGPDKPATSFLDFLRLKHAQATQETHRTAKDSIRKRLLRRRNNNNDDFILVSMYLA